jgi:hypothetical protein
VRIRRSRALRDRAGSACITVSSTDAVRAAGAAGAQDPRCTTARSEASRPSALWRWISSCSFSTHSPCLLAAETHVSRELVVRQRTRSGSASGSARMPRAGRSTAPVRMADTRSCRVTPAASSSERRAAPWFSRRALVIRSMHRWSRSWRPLRRGSEGYVDRAALRLALDRMGVLHPSPVLFALLPTNGAWMRGPRARVAVLPRRTAPIAGEECTQGWGGVQMGHSAPGVRSRGPARRVPWADLTSAPTWRTVVCWLSALPCPFGACRNASRQTIHVRRGAPCARAAEKVSGGYGQEGRCHRDRGRRD